MYINLVERLENGDALVCDPNNIDDQWVIPAEYFKEAYELIEE